MGERNLYFASCTRDGGIYHYRMKNDGELVYIDKTSCDRPMYMIQEERKLYVILREPYADSPFSGITTYDIDYNGRLYNGISDIRKVPDEQNRGKVMSTHGICCCHLCRFHGKLYGVNYLSGSVFSSDGILRTHEGRGFDDRRQNAPHPHFIAPSPDGRYLLVTDLGLDRIFVYDEGLELLGTVCLAQGAGPRHLAYMDDSHVVCINELDCSVTMFEYIDGVLIPGQTISVAEMTETSGGGCAAIRVRDNCIYVSNRGNNTISVIKAAEGEMELLSSVSCGGISPRDFMIFDSDLFCTNQGSSSVTHFHVFKEQIEMDGKGIKLAIPEVLCVCGDI